MIVKKNEHMAVNNIASLKNGIIKYKYIYLLLFPGIISYIIFNYIPIYGIQLAFKEYLPKAGITGSPWIGLENFKRLTEDASFVTALKNTVIISLIKILWGFPWPIILAILFNEIRLNRYKKVLQTIYTFPHFLSWVILSGIIINLFSSDGAVNNLLGVLNLPKTYFLTNPGTFRGFLVVTGIWKEVGWSTIIYMAVIVDIDQALYEAATVDGANRFHKIIYITLPCMSNIISVSFILAFSGILNAGFDQIFNLYNVSLYDVADVIDTYVYRISFQQTPSFGFSVAVGMFKGVINLALLLSVNKISKLFGNGSLFEGGVKK